MKTVMDNWFVSALLALLIYGLWGFFPKLAVAYISPMSAALYQVVGVMLVGLAILILGGAQIDTHPKGITFAVLTGVAGLLGTLCYYTAASRGRISVVVSLTALYPLITILLAALFLREPVTLRQVVGMAFALVAIFLMSA